MKRYSIFILCLSLAATLSTSAAALGKKKDRKKSAQKEQVDTVSMEVFSYALGKVNSRGLRQYLAQRMGVDTTYMADFLKGFQQTEMTEEDRRMKARLAGTEIRSQVHNELIPGALKQIADSTVKLNDAQFVSGFQDGVSGVSNGVSMDSTQQIIQKQMAYYHYQRMFKQYSANIERGEMFLKQNAKKDSVKVTPSGLQYKIIKKGDGACPQSTDRVKVNYEGRLIDGRVFDSSYKRGKPVIFPLNQVIKGWTEALGMMTVGSKWELFIPQELAYKDREQKDIPPFSCLVFTVELLEILPPASME